MKQISSTRFDWGGADTIPVCYNSSLLYIAASASVIGGLTSVFALYSSGQAAKATAAANADQAARQANQQLMSSQIQEAIAARQAAFDHNLAQAEAQAANQNSIAMRNEAEAEAAQSRENLKRLRDQQEQRKSTIINEFASSNIIDTTGTSLAVLATQAAQDQLAVNSEHYAADINRTHKLFQADILKEQGKEKSTAADFNFALANDTNTFRALGARISYWNTLRGGDLTKWQGNMQAANATASAVGQAFSTAGNAYRNFSGIGQSQPASTVTPRY